MSENTIHVRKYVLNTVSYICWCVLRDIATKTPAKWMYRPEVSIFDDGFVYKFATGLYFPPIRLVRVTLG